MEALVKIAAVGAAQRLIHCKQNKNTHFLMIILAMTQAKHIALVEVSFKGNRKSIFKNENNIQVILGEPVIVQIDKGLEFGRVSAVGVIAANKWKKESDAKYPQWSIVRNATEEDITQQKTQ
jgi:cell fate regulator YaaT (PSP1 superfamily)